MARGGRAGRLPRAAARVRSRSCSTAPRTCARRGCSWATERLDVIRRQRDEGLRDVVLAVSECGGTPLAVKLLEERGRVVEIPTRG